MSVMELAGKEAWQQFYNLLEEAVGQDHYEAVVRLLAFEAEHGGKKIPCPSSISIVPLLLAVEKKDVKMIKLFRHYNYSIPLPHKIDCCCEFCTQDKLGQTKSRLLRLKGISDPLWIAMDSKDPLLTLFQMTMLNRDLAKWDDSFHKDYEDIQKENEALCVHLLDEVRTENEGIILMRHTSDNDPFALIKLAIRYQQKEVIAHPVVQHFLTSAVFDGVPNWIGGSCCYKILLVMATGVLYPVTTLLNIISPKHTPLHNIANKPFVKFINGASSFITFLILLAVLGSSERSGIRVGESPSMIEMLVFVWLVGFCAVECKQVMESGVKEYFASGWNWVDIGMDTLMMYAFITWGVLSYHGNDEPGHVTSMHVADGAFTVAIIFSFFRILYLCQITSYLGLLQLCLGKMLSVILQFSFICIIVLTAFTVGMVFLFHASSSGATMKEEDTHTNHTAIYETMVENFTGFWSTMVTMIYVSLTMQGREILDDFSDGSLIHLWANLLFISYFGITMIVVLNMLIALMNKSYESIAENLTTEHLYSRTIIWLDYIGEDEGRPVPFNLVPTVETVLWVVRMLVGKMRFIGGKENNEKYSQGDVRSYENVSTHLINRHIRKTFGISIGDECHVFSGKENVEDEDEDDAFLCIVNTYLQQWTPHKV